VVKSVDNLGKNYLINKKLKIIIAYGENEREISN